MSLEQIAHVKPAASNVAIYENTAPVTEFRPIGRTARQLARLDITHTDNSPKRETDVRQIAKVVAMLQSVIYLSAHGLYGWTRAAFP